MVFAGRLVPGPVEDVPLWGTSASCAAANRRRGGLPTRRRLPACPTLSAPFVAVTEVAPRAEALSLRFLEHKMGRVFRSLAFGYGKPQRMKVQTIEQRLSLTEENG